MDHNKYKKQKIPKAVKEQLWLRDMGRVYDGKCKTAWCSNKVTAFDFQAGHIVAESKGGPTTLDNLVVICSRCNLSMANNFTFIEWSKKYKTNFIKKYFSCFSKKVEAS
jgi:5-methylcytosine-specific restriction endonuclease McrA